MSKPSSQHPGTAPVVVDCKNCGQQSSAAYCPDCGQRMDTSRFTWHEVWHHFTHALTHMDSGVGYSLKELAMRPGHSIREFLEGKRKRHFNAFTMMLTFTAFCSILYVSYGVETQLAGLRLNAFEESNPTIVHKFFAIRAVFLIVVCAAGDWLMFRDKGYDMPEMIILNTYQFSFISAAQLACLPLFIWSESAGLGPWIKGMFIFSALVYMFWTRRQFYRAGTKPGLNLRIVLLLALLYGVVAVTGRFIVRPFLLNMHHGPL